MNNEWLVVFEQWFDNERDDQLPAVQPNIQYMDWM